MALPFLVITGTLGIGLLLGFFIGRHINRSRNKTGILRKMIPLPPRPSSINK